MTKQIAKTLRCAIYTRVSTDTGLEQDFNSLDAQREASEAYIKSQAHEGWKLVRTAYDDGGFSGGSLERPALKKLLEDVKAKLIDVIIVYKVDRLTRSLADFAKLVELFDAQGVSFVSVTQSFNTTTSMGRLTLNVLLSFAQFEREVTSERIRDKIAASKKKGIWVGGTVPLGYRVLDRKLVIDGAEAPTVRMIFERYLALGSLLALARELNAKDIRTRKRHLANGRTIGGVLLTRGPLAHMLKNRTYIGELNHKDSSYPAEHQPLIDRGIFEAVQIKLAENLQSHLSERAASNALLLGKFFDDAGHTMSPTHARKKGLRYRYYVSRALVEGRAKDAGTVPRVSAEQVEIRVVTALRSLPDITVPNETTSLESRSAIRSLIDRVVLEKARLVVTLNVSGSASSGASTLEIPWERKRGRPKREVLLPKTDLHADGRPIRSETRATLVRALAKGRLWLDELVTGKVTNVEAIALREDRSRRSVHMIMSLAFVAPDIVEAAVSGQLPRGIGITRLVDLPSSWVKQRARLGLTPRA
ncbi:MAG TPA: recombinase family protein [Rhizomicrobium sp.]|nr:recombinase family protein [Rhizomicrobium sp.]